MPAKMYDMDPLEIRAVRGDLTQATFARQLGVSPATVRNWETGRARPGGSNLLRLMAYARGELDDGQILLGRTLPDDVLINEVAYRIKRGLVTS